MTQKKARGILTQKMKNTPNCSFLCRDTPKSFDFRHLYRVLKEEHAEKLIQGPASEEEKKEESEDK